MSLQTLDGKKFDAIVFGEREPTNDGWLGAMALQEQKLLVVRKKVPKINLFM